MDVRVSHPTNRPNYTEVHLGPLTVVFSYETPIGYYPPVGGRVIRENDWSTTTGKHLTYLDGGSKDARAARVSGVEFMAGLERWLDAFRYTATDA